MTSTPGSSGPSRLTTIFGIAGLVVIVIVIVVVMSENRRSADNPFDLDLEAYNRIDADLITYAITQQIPVDCRKLFGVAVDDHDFIYASTDSCIVKFNPFGSEMLSFETLLPVRSMDIVENGVVYGADGALKQELFTQSDSSIITSIAVAGDDLFIADAGAHIVLRYDLAGELLNEIGGRDVKPGRPGFVLPSAYFDLAVAGDDRLWVVNPGLHTFENYNFAGALLAEWGRASSEIEGFCGCCNPSHFALIPGSGFVTSEKGLVRIKIYDQEGQLETVVSGPDNFKKQATGLDLAVDSQQRIIVADPSSKMIRIFERKTGS